MTPLLFTPLLFTLACSLVHGRLLEKFEVAVKDSELNKLAGLRQSWQEYRRMLSEVSTRLQKAKTDFKDDLLQSLTAFNDLVQTVRNEFQRNAPFDAGLPQAKAKELINEYKEQVPSVVITGHQ